MANSRMGNISAFSKKAVFFIIKIGIGAGLIYWLYRQDRLDFSSIGQFRFDFHTVLMVLTGAISVFAGLILLSWRLRILLLYQRFDVSFKMAFNLTLVGSFFGVALPGLVGGDAVKAAYICSNLTDRRSGAVAAIMVDRIIGLSSLFLLGSIAASLALCLASFPVSIEILLLAPSVVLCLIIFFFIAARESFFNNKMINNIYSRCPRKLQNLVKALRAFLKSPKIIFQAVVLSVLNHALVVISFLVAALLLNDSLSVFTHFVLNPLAMVMNVIPLTPGGIGITESAFSFLYQIAGSSNGAAVGLLGRLIQYLVFISSGIIALLFLKMRCKIDTVISENIL